MKHDDSRLSANCQEEFCVSRPGRARHCDLETDNVGIKSKLFFPLSAKGDKVCGSDGGCPCRTAPYLLFF